MSRWRLTTEPAQWFGVRCVVLLTDLGESPVYEERITMWRVEGADASVGAAEDEAIALAEAEAERYASDTGGTHLGFAQSFAMYDTPRQGAEVFSLMRASDLAPDPYLDRFFATGRESERTLDAE